MKSAQLKAHVIVKYKRECIKRERERESIKRERERERESIKRASRE